MSIVVEREVPELIGLCGIGGDYLEHIGLGFLLPLMPVEEVSLVDVENAVGRSQVQDARSNCSTQSLSTLGAPHTV